MNMIVGIVGAGITGLTIAHGLLKKGHEVIVYKRNQLGGLAGGVPFQASLRKLNDTRVVKASIKESLYE